MLASKEDCSAVFSFYEDVMLQKETTAWDRERDVPERINRQRRYQPLTISPVAEDSGTFGSSLIDAVRGRRSWS